MHQNNRQLTLISGEVLKRSRFCFIMQGKKVCKTIQKGNKEQIETLFAGIYQQYFKLMYFVAFSYLKNEQYAEDVCQETFLSFFEKCTDFDWLKQIANIKSYLCKCAKNLAIKEAKNRQRVDQIENDESFSSYENSSNYEFELRRFLLKLDQESLEIINDHIFLDLSFKDIAQKRQSSINTVKSKYRRAMEKIRREYIK